MRAALDRGDDLDPLALAQLRVAELGARHDLAVEGDGHAAGLGLDAEARAAASRTVAPSAEPPPARR